MGLRGPLPKSAAQAALDGNTGHRPLPTAAYRPSSFGAPECPKKLTAAAKRIWSAQLDSLAHLGILTSANAWSLAMLCEDMADMEELQAGRRRMVSDLQKRARQDARRAKAIAGELVTAQGEAKEALLTERSEIEARKMAGGPDVALAMSQEGRRLLGEINRYAQRIARREMQFGLTPASAARVGTDGMGAGMASVASAPVDELEMRIQ